MPSIMAVWSVRILMIRTRAFIRHEITVEYDPRSGGLPSLSMQMETQLSIVWTVLR